MGNQIIREPVQQRSIDKRNRIIEAGYQLFSEKGYYNTNTVEIAKLAGVSTGIVYSYFKDKKDIFILSIETYYDNIASPLFEQISKIKTPLVLDDIVRQIIVMMTHSHTLVKSVHEEMQALAHTDEDISELFCRFQASMAQKLVTNLEEYDIRPTNAYEKAHLIINMVENLVHEIVYHHHEYLNYDVMTEEAINVIKIMLAN
ncbi:MAG TPA: TetR/AcrR family transcriptional regulator [Mobilitalea sp.]|nr:TetR/AcrR family transcriptional regulator [Mobilitalea sp.]